jgi:hypothetical protein
MQHQSNAQATIAQKTAPQRHIDLGGVLVLVE